MDLSRASVLSRIVCNGWSEFKSAASRNFDAPSPLYLKEIGGGFQNDFEFAIATDERGELLLYPLAVTTHQPLDNSITDPNEEFPPFRGRGDLFKMGRREV
jgi:hypothetical protein